MLLFTHQKIVKKKFYENFYSEHFQLVYDALFSAHNVF